MQIKIKEISKEILEKNGWKCHPRSNVYYKKFNECWVGIIPLEDEQTHGCWISYAEVATPDDLVAIGNELKKLEENK